MKKSISILLVIVMVSGILSGCGIKKSNTENNKENTQTVTDLHSTEKVKDTQSTDKSGDTGETENMQTSENSQTTENAQATESSQTTENVQQTGGGDGQDNAQTAGKPEETNSNFAVPSVNGKLHVKGGKLCDAKGNQVQLRGVSTHGIAWYPQYVSKECFASLKKWGANVVRISMYTYENGGYCTGGDKDRLKKLVKDGVRYAAENDMYAIIDWHVLNERNPNTYSDQAKTFFAEMAKEFSGSNNVIYEICNEPNNGASWGDVKFYASEVIPSIRDYDKDGVILIGTPDWCQDIDQAVSDPIKEYDNIMYTFHFYASTHKEDMRKKLKAAAEEGIPVFVSEFGISDASGNGQIDIESANAWVSLMDQYGISYVCWNMSNKDESSAIVSKDCEKTYDFTLDDLSQEGQWLYYMLLTHMSAETN